MKTDFVNFSPTRAIQINEKLFVTHLVDISWYNIPPFHVYAVSFFKLKKESCDCFVILGKQCHKFEKSYLK